MKKTLLLIFSVVSLTLFGNSRTKTISMTFNANDFQLIQEDSCTIISSNVYDLFYDDDNTLPALPHLSINVLIAPNEIYQGFNYNLDSIALWNDITVKPCELPISLDEEYSPIQINQVSWNSFYPANVIYTGSHNMDDYKMLSFVISPYSYNGSTGELALNQKLNLSISLDTIITNHTEFQYISKPGINMPEQIEESVINHDEMTSLYGEPMEALETPINVDYFPYLIITKESYRSAFEPLVRWKTIKGMRAKILTVEEIDSTFDGNTAPLRIKSALRFYRNHHFTKYVLLGGDENSVPVQKCYLSGNSSNNGFIEHELACDLYYSCFGDMVWDTNGDGVATKAGDKEDIDLYPSIIVTRIPSQNTTEVNAFVNRIIDYEQHPSTNNWTDNVLMCGLILAKRDSILGRPRSDAEKFGEEIYNGYISPYWNGERTRFFDTYTDMPEGAEYDFIAGNIVEQLNRGFTFVHVDTHGTTRRWVTEDGDGFYRSNARSVNNAGYSVIATTACSTNNFDEDDTCLSQALLGSQRSGVLAYFGSSREGWLGHSHTLNEFFFQSIFEDPYHRFGEASKNAKYQLIQSDNLKRKWLNIAVNPMGDPEMPVFISLPQTRTDAKIDFKNNSLHVKCDYDDFKACVTSIDDYGETYFSIKNSENGEVIFTGVPDSCRLCITAPGYIPYLQTIFKNVYIQNETISDSRHIVTDRLFMGTNVTDTTPMGPVVIENGAKLDVSYGNGVYIMPETEIKKGAIINIQSN